MERRKAIRMLIDRYKADAEALERRERDLMRQVEIIENLIPTVTVAYMSRTIQARDMVHPQPEIEEAKERLEHLKRSLKELQQSIAMIRKEESVMNERIGELERFLSDIPYQYTDNNIDICIARADDVVGSSDIAREEERPINVFKTESFQDRRQKLEGFIPAEIIDSEDNFNADTIGNVLPTDNRSGALTNVAPEEDVTGEKEREILQNERSFHQGIESEESLPAEHIDLEQFPSKQIGNVLLKPNKPSDTLTLTPSLDITYEKEIIGGFIKDQKSKSEEYIPAEVIDLKQNSSKNFGTGTKNDVQNPDFSINYPQDSDATQEKEKPENIEIEKLNFEELLKTEDTDWKQVCDNLSHQVHKLSEYLENSSQKLRDSEDYVKHLEEECSKLEEELLGKIESLEKKDDKFIDEEKIKLSQKGVENEVALYSMPEDLMKTSTMNEILTDAASRQSMMGEGEGVTPAYMQLAHWRFALKLPEYQADRELKEKLMNGIKQGNMAPYYKEVCADLGWEFDSKLFDEMSAANVKRLEELEKEHENNVMDEEDQSQLCGVWQSKLDYLCSIGDSENATALANSKVDDKTVPKSHRIDAVFSLFRISFFHGCNIKGMSTAIEKATELIEGISGGDWSARNKLKAYEGVWSLAIRDFTRAAHLFVDVVPTFESYELADFGTIIRYTVLSCMIALPRCDLRKKLMLHGVMAQALHSQYQDLREYFVSLYDGRYSDFLVCLARIEVEMKRDPLLHPHYRHYVQEMRLRAYKQILQAYRSLSLDYMAQSFGVTSEFIEREVARFAAAGRLQCKIDSVAGTVITSAHLDDSVRSKEAPEASQDRNILYQTTVKRGDILLNRLKKLARVMDF